MKNYNEVAESVFERSKELIIKKNKKYTRTMIALKTTAISCALISAVGFGSWWSSNQGCDIVLSSGSASLPFVSDTNSETTAAESKNPPPVPVSETTHTHRVIESLNTVRDNFETPPENGKVYISSELQNALDTYGDSFKDGCKAPYSVILDYYKDGELVELYKELGDSECARLHDFIYNLYVSEEYPINAALSCVQTNWEYDNGETEHKTELYGTLYKEQIENFLPNEEYAIVLNLDAATIIFPASPSKQFCPDHGSNFISSYPKHGTDYSYAPANGTVYISEALRECMNNNSSQQYDDGCRRIYQVKPVYFKDGKALDYFDLCQIMEDEKQRLQPFVYENFDVANCPTIIIETFSNDGDGVEATLTKELVESFTALEGYGISLYLAYNYELEKDGEYNIEDPEFAGGHF